MADTPMMRQYEQAKRVCPDALLLFRMGDFYELFHDDARQAARLLNLTLTSRDKGDNPVPMAGFPHHQLENYLGKLITAGQRVAVCDQVEDPRKAKGLVKRDVTRVVSPGTLTDDGLLDPRESNYLAAVVQGEPAGLAWVDLSTGRFQAATIAAAELADHLARIAAVECLLSQDAASLPESAGPPPMITRRPPWAFSQRTATEVLTKHFGTHSLEGFGFESPEDQAPAIRAAGGILDYLQESQKTSLDHIDRLLPYRAGTTLEIDQATRRSLEITRTMRDDRREGSLLGVLDRTVTAMGARVLAEWVANPLTDIEAIDARLAAVDELKTEDTLADALREQLRGIYDMQRLLARVATGRASPRDLSFIARTLRGLPQLKERLTGRTSGLLQELQSQLDPCADICSGLDAALADDCPLTSREGGFIRAGYNTQLDQLRDLATGNKQWIAAYQAEECQRTGIPNIKIGFNKVFGYYLEVTHAHTDKVPENFIRKQTIKNAERYITPELKEHEEKVLTAEERTKDLEYSLFVALRDTVSTARSRLQATAHVLAQLDVLCGLADLARNRGYCRPTLTSQPRLDIVDGRHPVLDTTLPEGTFVPNSTQTGPEEGQILIVTGPNMAGKSTYIRQVALLTLMAQIGSFVPAGKATIGVADRIFARVGASDELSRGQSTFMVEMTETARILNTATPRSLVILDEIGRGTSTYDGLSLAWSVVEYLHDRIGCRTLFATHYHELTDLTESLTNVRNLNVAVREWEDKVVFLHQIVPGAADKSYGIHVARLAGVPREVNQRAQEILALLEDEHLDQEGRPRIARDNRSSGPIQMTLFGTTDHPILEKIRRVDLSHTTPLVALGIIQQWQEELEKELGANATSSRS
jgi:DNA mismatch repair protein MutS